MFDAQRILHDSASMLLVLQLQKKKKKLHNNYFTGWVTLATG